MFACVGSERVFPYAGGVRRRHSPVSAGRRIHVWETNGNMIDQPLQLQRRTVKFEFGTRFQYDVVGPGGHNGIAGASRLSVVD